MCQKTCGDRQLPPVALPCASRPRSAASRLKKCQLSPELYDLLRMQVGVYEATMESTTPSLDSESAQHQHSIQWHATAEQHYANLVPTNAFSVIASESQLQLAAIPPQYTISDFDQLVDTITLVAPPLQHQSTSLTVAPSLLSMPQAASYQTYASPLALLAHVALPPSPETTTVDPIPSSMTRQVSLASRESFVRNSQPQAEERTQSSPLPSGIVPTTAPLSVLTAFTPPIIPILESHCPAVALDAEPTPSQVSSHADNAQPPIQPPVIKLDRCVLMLAVLNLFTSAELPLKAIWALSHRLTPRRRLQYAFTSATTVRAASAPAKVSVCMLASCTVQSLVVGSLLSVFTCRSLLTYQTSPTAYQCPLPNCQRIQVSLSNAQRHLVGHGPAFRNLPLRPVDIPTNEADQYLSKRAKKRTSRATSSTSSSVSSSSTQPPPSSNVSLTPPAASSSMSPAQPPSQEPFLPPPASLRELDYRALTRSGLYPMLAPPENGYSTHVPLPPVTPSGRFARYAVPIRTSMVGSNVGPTLHEGVVEERDSFADAPEWPYHPSGWNVRPLLPGPAPLPGALQVWIPSTAMQGMVRTVLSGPVVGLVMS